MPSSKHAGPTAALGASAWGGYLVGGRWIVCLCSSHLVALWPRPLSSVFLYLNSTLEGQSMARCTRSRFVWFYLVMWGGVGADSRAA